MPKNHKWNTSDTITSLRIALSLFIPFFPLGSTGFFVVYTFAGLTDALDGCLARKTGTASEFGAKLDSIADLLFYGILLLRLFPVFWQTLPRAIWFLVAAIVLIRLAAYAVAAVRFHQFASLHTWLNKLTGACVFLLPYLFAVSTAGIGYCWVVCILALAAAMEELTLHLCQNP